MTNFLWVLTKKRQALMDALIKIPEIGRKSKSELIEWALEEFVKKHGKSFNPQTQIEMFDKESILAVPNLYEILDNPELWKKFYKNMKRKKDYLEFDKAINALVALHNKSLKNYG